MTQWKRTIPPNFDEEWAMSDVELRTQNEDQRKLYANKAVLASFSPYFQSLFFSEFREARAGHANVPTSYETMQEILRILYHVDVERPLTYPSQTIYDLYSAADELDFPLIRKICEDQLLALEPSDAIPVARALNLTEIQSTIMSKMSAEELLKFFDEGQGDFVAPMKDVAKLLRKVASTDSTYPCCHRSILARLAIPNRMLGEGYRRHHGLPLSPAVRALFDPVERRNAAREEE